MPGANLTRDEARARSSLISDVSYRISLDLTGDGATFPSRTEVSFSAEPGSETWLDLRAAGVSRIELNGVELDPTVAFAKKRISLPGLAARNTVIVEAECKYMSTGEGLHKFVDPVDDRVYLYSQCEIADCRRIFAVFEQPDIKAPMQLTVRAPEAWQVISNRATPTPEPAENGTAVWAFEPTWPLPSYLFALIAGEYASVHDVYRGPNGDYPLGLFCRQSLADSLDGEDIFEITKQGFAFFEEAFDYPYPFGKYDQLFVPEFNAGAMENPGAVTFHEDHYIFRSRVTEASYEMRAETILHEMAHMWFGDLVTMRWWDDLWLNESFAEWAAHVATSRATRFPHAWASFANQRKAWAYRADQLPSTHPVAADMVDLESVYANFDGITYAKGASVLKQLVAFVGEENFLAGLHTYFVDNAFGNTEFKDLLDALEDASGKDLHGWAASWLQSAGVNLLHPEFTLDDNGSYTSFAVLQEPASMPPGVAQVLRPHQFHLGLYDVRDGDLQLRERIALTADGPRTEVPDLLGVAQPDLLLINDGDETYAKVRLDPRSLNSSVEWLGNLTDPLTRALVWGAAWDMTRDAELPTSEFVALVAGSIGSETDVGLVGQVLRQTASAVSMYADPGQKASYQSLLASALRSDLESADPGSDHQLAYLRGLITFAGNADIAFLRSLLSGDEIIAGLTVDTDVRWAIVVRLVALGAMGSEDIDAQLALDDTAAGRRRAITARAAAQDLGAKQAAWESALDDAELPNAALSATIAGIVQPEQGELMRPFVERYFTALPRIAKKRTHEISSLIVTGLYPALLVEAATITRTDAFLEAHPKFPASSKRLLLEARDGVERAMRCVARDRDG